jgi:limonene-1,2-epoxide hydrolase
MAEPAGDVTQGPFEQREAGSTPRQVVEQFLECLRSGDIDGSVELLAADVRYTNVGLPTIRGRERVRRAFQATLGRRGARFDVYVHSISADGPTVLTERTDVLEFGRLRVQFWVCGRFDVSDAQIVLWRDYFDQAAIAAATIRGLLGTIVPAARAKPPSTPAHCRKRPTQRRFVLRPAQHGADAAG